MDKYQDLTLPQLTALFTERKAAFDALLAKQTPTVADVTAATELKADLLDIKAAEKALTGFGSLGDEFAEKKTSEQKQEEKNLEENRTAQPPKGEDTPDVPIGEQTRSDETGDKDAEQARVSHEETIQDPVDPQQVDRGQIAGPEGDGEDLPTREGLASAVVALAGRGTEAPLAPHRRRGRATIHASSGLDSHAAGQPMDDLLSVATAAIGRARSFPEYADPTGELATLGQTGGHKIEKFGTATIDLDIPDELMVDEVSMTPHAIDEVLRRAGDESTLPGGSLTAAGGWCAPSETIYDLTMEATTDGMLSHPEVGIRRGGLRWPLAPNFSDFYANPGFKYTEAQVIAGVTKPCITIPCPSFDEARLSVEGLCVKVDILTNVGYPEVVRNYIDGTMVAHEHWMNATKIAAMATIAGAAVTLPGLGSTTTDTLNGLEIQGERTRQTYKLGLGSTLEVVLPYWVRSAIRADLANRSGMAPDAVSDQQINALFRARRMNVQFVYDWQELPLVDVAGTAGVNEAVGYPATFNALMYPAGTFIFGTAPVINLSTIYDAASLAANQYTGLFTEQGWLVAKRRFHANLFTLPVCNAGRTGASNMTCP